MNTHRSLMIWPITERGLTMTPGELIAEALDAICECLAILLRVVQKRNSMPT